MQATRVIFSWLAVQFTPSGGKSNFCFSGQIESNLSQTTFFFASRILV